MNVPIKEVTVTNAARQSWFQLKIKKLPAIGSNIKCNFILISRIRLEP